MSLSAITLASGFAAGAPTCPAPSQASVRTFSSLSLIPAMSLLTASVSEASAIDEIAAAPIAAMDALLRSLVDISETLYHHMNFTNSFSTRPHFTLSANLVNGQLPQFGGAADIIACGIWSVLLLVFVHSAGFGQTITWRRIRHKLLDSTETVVLDGRCQQVPEAQLAFFRLLVRLFGRFR
jgi:hypothetical protein